MMKHRKKRRIGSWQDGTQRRERAYEAETVTHMQGCVSFGGMFPRTWYPCLFGEERWGYWMGKFETIRFSSRRLGLRNICVGGFEGGLQFATR